MKHLPPERNPYKDQPLKNVYTIVYNNMADRVTKIESMFSLPVTFSGEKYIDIKMENNLNVTVSIKEELLKESYNSIQEIFDAMKNAADEINKIQKKEFTTKVTTENISKFKKK